MAQIGFQNIGKMMKKLEKHKLLLVGRVTLTKKNLVRAVLTDLVIHTPQWSGNLTQQWYVETTGYQGRYHPKRNYAGEGKGKPLTFPALQMGDPAAVNYTLKREEKRINALRWNSLVQISNVAPYALAVEEGTGPNGTLLRPENTLPGGVGTLAYVSMKYNNLRNFKGVI